MKKRTSAMHETGRDRMEIKGGREWKRCVKMCYQRWRVKMWQTERKGMMEQELSNLVLIFL